MHKRISTTVAKAKALRKYVEPLLTKSKKDDTHSRRVVFAYLQDKNAVTELFRTISPKIADRPGGYTRILHTGFRIGDTAEMCIIELVDFNENYSQNKGAQKAVAKATRRGGRRSKKSETTASAETTATETQAVETAEEVTVENNTIEQNSVEEVQNVETENQPQTTEVTEPQTPEEPTVAQQEPSQSTEEQSDKVE
jgi:large subunit ribosomal protein L17